MTKLFGWALFGVGLAAAGCAGFKAGHARTSQSYAFTTTNMAQMDVGLCKSALDGIPVARQVEAAGSATGVAKLVTSARASKNRPRLVRHEAAKPQKLGGAYDYNVQATLPDTWTLEGVSGSWAAAELAPKISALGGAYGALHLAAQSCYADAVHMAMVMTIEDMYDEGNWEPEAARALARKYFDRAFVAMKQESTLLALLAAYQGALDGRVKPAELEALVKAAPSALQSSAQPTDADFELAWNAGAKAAHGLDEWTRKWGEPESQRLSLLGLLRASARARRAEEGDSYGSARESASARGSDPQRSGGSDFLLGLLRGDPAALVRGAAQLLPADSDFRRVIDGAGALAQGDVVGALTNAAALAPKDSSWSKALGPVVAGAQLTKNARAAAPM